MFFSKNGDWGSSAASLGAVLLGFPWTWHCPPVIKNKARVRGSTMRRVMSPHNLKLIPLNLSSVKEAGYGGAI